MANLGDDEMKADFEERAAAYDPSSYWASHERDLQYVAERESARAQDKKGSAKAHKGQRRFQDSHRHDQEKKHMTDKSNASSQQVANAPMDVEPQPLAAEPYNRFEGDRMAKQLDESLENFFTRLPPSTTSINSGPWICVANPLSRHRLLKSDIGGFKEAAPALLENFLQQRSAFEAEFPTRAAASITRMMAPYRDRLEQDIFKLARQKKVMSGKWMLFPFSHLVDEAWHKVAIATVRGELGSTAKVATDDGAKNRVRQISIYTDDFSDREEAKRVLGKLRDLRLVGQIGGGEKEPGIYYKCEAYSCLDINRSNEYKLKTSLYSSKDLFQEMG